jgi:hypothetical protein
MPRLTPNPGRLLPEEFLQTVNGVKYHAIGAQQNEYRIQKPSQYLYTAIPPSPYLPEPQVSQPCQWISYNASRRYIPGDLHVGRPSPRSGVNMILSYSEREECINFRLQCTTFFLSKRCLSLQHQRTIYNAGIA